MLVPRDFQQAAIQRLLQGSFGLWWKPGVGKTLPLALASAQQPLQTLWLTLPEPEIAETFTFVA